MTNDRLSNLTPRQLEELVGEIFANEGFEVSVTPATRDGGIDVFAERRNSLGLRDQWIIECKLYREDRPIGVDLVRQLVGVRELINARNAALVTTSQFTIEAQRAAAHSGIELVDRTRLLSWLGSLPPRSIPTEPAPRFHTVFISHSYHDFDFAVRLDTALRAKGIKTWFSHNDLDVGTKIHEGVFSAIDSFDRVIVVLSVHSMKSQWVKTELHRAFQRQRKEGRNVLFPVSIVPFSALQAWSSFDPDSGKDLAVEIREYLVPVLSDPTSESEFNRFVDAIVKGLSANDV